MSFFIPNNIALSVENMNHFDISEKIIFSESAPVVESYQTLPHVPGYVPVYIRKGDTPLEEINLELAEAFRSHEEKSNYHTALGTKLDYISSNTASTGDNSKNLLSSSNENSEDNVKGKLDLQ